MNTKNNESKKSALIDALKACGVRAEKARDIVSDGLVASMGNKVSATAVVGGVVTGLVAGCLSLPKVALVGTISAIGGVTYGCVKAHQSKVEVVKVEAEFVNTVE